MAREERCKSKVFSSFWAIVHPFSQTLLFSDLSLYINIFIETFVKRSEMASRSAIQSSKVERGAKRADAEIVLQGKHWLWLCVCVCT